MKQSLFPFFISFLILVAFGQTMAQTTINGKWSGKIELPAAKLEVIFQIETDSANQLTAWMSVPMQGVKNLVVNKTEITSDSMTLTVPR